MNLVQSIVRFNLWRGRAMPLVSRRHPDIRGMAEQIGLALLFGPEPPRHGLRRRVFAVNAVDDPVEFEAGECPVDRRLTGDIALGVLRRLPAADTQINARGFSAFAPARSVPALAHLAFYACEP
jgi:hypothetical protein